MNTFQIIESTLTAYKNEKLSQERIDFLSHQATVQLDEIAQNEALYTEFLETVNAPEEINKLILWILFMSNEDICIEYINTFKKDFRKILPLSDLADLLLYSVYLEKVKHTHLEGFVYLLTYQEEGLDEIDQYAFTNALLYIQKSKEITLEF